MRATFQMFVHVSGAHLNPAITAAAVMLGLVEPQMALVYVAADCAGACLGYRLLTVSSQLAAA